MVITLNMAGGTEVNLTECSQEWNGTDNLLQTSIHYVRLFLSSGCQLLVTANVVPCSPILFTLMMEALSSSETSDLTRSTRHNISEDGIIQSLHFYPYIHIFGCASGTTAYSPEDQTLHIHRRQDLTSYVTALIQLNILNIIIILNIIHRPVFYFKNYVSETLFSSGTYSVGPSRQS
jgi:hypothetical protein